MNNEFKIFKLNKFRKIKNDSYNDKEECLKHSYKYGKEYQTNPKFKKFDQTYYHAGDQQDINKYALLPLRYVYSNEKEEDIKKDKIFKLYKKIDYTSVRNTFDYMFNKFKKGIFVIIHDGKLVLFLPFSNENYKNNWVKQTYFSEEEKKMLLTEDYDKIKHKLNKNIIEFLKKHPEQHKMIFDRSEWYANNCIFRNKFPDYEGELNTNVYKDMLEELVKNRNIPNVEFFINDRDFPLLKNDYTEPYHHLFDSNTIKIEKKYQFEKMCPIFSKSITNKFADVLLPTNDDWVMASNKFFTASCSNSYHKETWDKINTNWNTKKQICIFRGGATGCGITIETNMRLKAADLSVDYPDLLDAGITDWKARPRKYMDRPIEIIDTQKLRFKLANKEINNIEKSNYKYILNIDGYVSAYRLSSELSMNSVILLVKSEYKLWFSDMLKEYIHYVPVNSNLDNLIEQIRWCIDNDKKCIKIANNAKLFYDKHLTKDSILDYMQAKLLMIYSNKNFKNLLNIKKSPIHIAIISCFRDKGNGERERERKLYIQTMNRLLEPYCNFKIYIIEQSNDGEFFNIGKLKNIGFEIASKEHKFDNYIFSDIDTIPDYDLMTYITKSYKNILSLAIRGTRYSSLNNKIKKPFLGAMIQVNEKLFKKINGYPNNFWGWGGEDDSIMNRLLECNNNIIYYPKIGSIIDIEEDIHMKTINNIKTKLSESNKNIIKFEKLYSDLTIWGENGLSNLHYKLINKTDINRNTTQFVVDLQKDYDEKKHKNWFPKPMDDYLSIQKEVKQKYYSIKIEYV